MTKQEEIELAYRERDLQEEKRTDAINADLDRQREYSEYLMEFKEEARNKELLKREEEKAAKKETEIENVLELFNKGYEPSDNLPKHHSSIDYEALTINAIMNGDGDLLGFD